MRKLYTQLEARLPTGCGWSQTYQQDDAEYFVDAIERSSFVGSKIAERRIPWKFGEWSRVNSVGIKDRKIVQVLKISRSQVLTCWFEQVHRPFNGSLQE